MRGFTVTVSPNGKDNPSHIQPVGFPQWPWFLLAYMLWSANRKKDEFPQAHPDGGMVYLGFDARGRVCRITTIDANGRYRREIIRS